MLKAVEDRKNEYLEFMKKVISLKTLTCEEKPMADFLIDFFEGLGIDVFRDGAGNVVAKIPGEGKGPNILMNGHMDAVHEGSLDAWKPYEPYTPTIEGDLLYGRGICDMKGGLSAQCMAMKTIKEEYVDKGHKLPGDLYFLGVVQEEPAEMFGMEYFFNHTVPEHNIKVDLVYLGEPSSNDVVVGQRGKVELVVRTYGKVAHSSAPEQGINAIQLMVPVLDRLFKHEGINLVTDEKTGVSNITVTNITASPGGNLSVIPDICEISVDRRYATSQTIDDLVKEFEDMFAEIKKEIPEFKATVEPRVYTETSYTGYTTDVKKAHPAWDTGKDDPYVLKSLEALHDLGQDPDVKYWLFGTDGGCTQAEHGIPTIGYSGGEEPQAHQAKEHVSITEMNKTYEGYVAMLAKIYGIDINVFA
jgi:putative selenium metabolism hydrolase